jgi:hypothetical protein
LRILVIGAFPLAIIDHYVALARIKRRSLRAAGLVIAGGVIQVGMAAAGARIGGLDDLTIGWVIGLAVTSVCMAPLVYRTVVGGTEAPLATLVERRT